MSGAAVFGNALPDENLQTQAVLVHYDGHSTTSTSGPLNQYVVGKMLATEKFKLRKCILNLSLI
jgi:hypothetical protein